MIARRVLSLTALVAAGGLLLAGCLPFPFGPTPSRTSTPTLEQVAPELAPYYHQQLVWRDCQDGFQCTEATAPLDWSDPSAGDISLALIRHRATGKRVGSLLVNPGGPGGSGWSFIADSLDFAVGQPLIERFDIIGFDPRGVGRSSAVSCGTPAQLDSYYFDVRPYPPGSDAWVDDALQRGADWSQQCLDGTGPLLAHIDTASAAHDMDMLRAALGDEKLDYLGYSYGTLLGAQYAQDFPDRAGRLVLDGAVDPSADPLQATIFQAVGFENAFRAYVADCLTHDACPFAGMSVDEAVASTRDLLDRVAENPIPGDDGRLLGGDTLFSAIVLPLYSESNWPYLDDLFTELKTGGTQWAFLLADAYYDREADGTYSTNSTEAFLAIGCADRVPGEGPTTPEEVAQTQRDDAAATIAAAPLFGPNMGWGVQCWKWPFPGVGSLDPITAPGSPDILVIGTTNDPATPYQEAVTLASTLAKGHLVTYHGEGHTAYNGGNACVDSTVEDFLIDGVVPEADPNC
ncbi:MAG: alpha/beta fold hydrolase [Actinomycetales bacterium]|nr:alpha/beta fold hydrolase [Actinomycetales bacterium]